jgi:hypothetical protein
LGKYSTRHIRKVSTIRLFKKTEIYFQNVLFVSDSQYLKLLLCIVCTVIKAFIITGHQFLYLVLIERGHLLRCHWPQTAPRLVMHVITTFSELSLHFPHHSITHGISTVYFTYLMNISQFHISCIQKTIILNVLNAQNNMYTLSAFLILASLSCL